MNKLPDKYAFNLSNICKLDGINKQIVSEMKKEILTIFLVLTTMTVFSQFPEFRYHEIGQTEEDLLGQSSLADIDKDGDLDFIVGTSAGTIWWFEYDTVNTWKRHVLGIGVFTDKGGVAFDVDNDGWIDQL